MRELGCGTKVTPNIHQTNNISVLFEHYFHAFFLYIEYLLTYGELTAQKDKKIELTLFDEFGDGKTGEDEIVKNLTFTCEEGIDYSKI